MSDGRMKKHPGAIAAWLKEASARREILPWNVIDEAADLIVSQAQLLQESERRLESVRRDIAKQLDQALSHNFSDAMDRAADGYTASRYGVVKNAEIVGEEVSGEALLRAALRGAIHSFLTEVWPDWVLEARALARPTADVGKEEK